jgi:hypothetical protein
MNVNEHILYFKIRDQKSFITKLQFTTTVAYGRTFELGKYIEHE